MTAGVKEAAQKLGWEGYETDYHALIARPDIQLVDVSTPGDTHKEVVLAALAAGKHVICEKPLANNLAEAREMLEAAEASGAIAVVNYNYRTVPAVQVRQEAHRRWGDRRSAALARGLPPGLDHRPRLPARLAACRRSWPGPARWAISRRTSPISGSTSWGRSRRS